MSDRRSEIYDRIMQNVYSIENPEMGGPCWIWKGADSGKEDRGRAGRGHSYPRMKLNGKTVAVHRVMATHVYGFIPTHMTVDHKCRNRKCVRDKHLEIVSHKENCKRRDKAKLIELKKGEV